MNLPRGPIAVKLAAAAVVMTLIVTVLMVRGGNKTGDDPNGQVIAPTISDADYDELLDHGPHDDDETSAPHPDLSPAEADQAAVETEEFIQRSIAEQFVTLRETYSWADGDPLAWTQGPIKELTTPTFLSELHAQYAASPALNWSEVTAAQRSGSAAVTGSAYDEALPKNESTVTIIVGYRLSTSLASQTVPTTGQMVFEDRLTLTLVEGFWRVTACDRAFNSYKPA